MFILSSTWVILLTAVSVKYRYTEHKQTYRTRLSAVQQQLFGVNGGDDTAVVYYFEVCSHVQCVGTVMTPVLSQC